MKTSELRPKTLTDLEKHLSESRQTLLENKKSLAAGELPNPRVVTKTRREIARIKTLITQKQSAETSKGDA